MEVQEPKKGSAPRLRGHKGILLGGTRQRLVAGAQAPAQAGAPSPTPITHLRRAEPEVITASMVQTDLRARLLAARSGRRRQGLPRQGDVRRQHKAVLRRPIASLLQATAAGRAGREYGPPNQLRHAAVGSLHGLKGLQSAHPQHVYSGKRTITEGNPKGGCDGTSAAMSRWENAAGSPMIKRSCANWGALAAFGGDFCLSPGSGGLLRTKGGPFK